MNKLMLLSGAALLTLSGTAIAQSSESQPAPDTPTSTPAPADTAAAPTEAAPPAPAADSAAPTTAQSTVPAADAAATTPTAPAEDIAAAPAPALTTDVAAAPAPAAATANADAAAKVNADWAKYDEGNKGKLTPLEFGSWVMAARGQDVTAQVEQSKTSKRSNLPAIKVLNATASDFAKADTDKDKTISPNELAAFLSA